MRQYDKSAIQLHLLDLRYWALQSKRREWLLMNELDEI